MRLHKATCKLCGLTLVLLPEDIWKTHNCTVLPLPWDLFEDASQYVLCICTVQEGIWHCYQIEVKVMWKECNLHQYVEEQSTFKDMVKPPLAKEPWCLVLPSKGSSWRTRCHAVPCKQSHQLSASEAFLLRLKGSLWATGAGPLT